MTIGIYARVSTQKQAEKGISIEDQIRRGKDFCNKRKFSYEIFSDEGYSGDLPIEKRPNLTKLFEKIFLKKKEIDGIFVVDFDRLTRNAKEALTIREILIENDVQLFELNGPVNLKDPTQELLLGIKGLLGAFERKKTIVRIKRTFETSVLQGKALGGKLTNYGFTKNENKILIIEPNEAKIIKRIFKLCLEGLGTKKIAEQLNKEGIPTKRMILGGAKLKVRNVEKRSFLWRDSVIHKILTNPIYKGERHFKEHIIKCPAIIDESVFDAVQKSLKQRTNFKNTTNKYFYLLKGLLICSECSSKFYGRRREDLSDNQYICLSQRYREEYCGTRGINITKLENWIWESVMNLPSDFKKALLERTNEPQVTNRNKSIKMLHSEIKTLEKEAENILNLFKGKSANENRFTKKRLIEIEEQIKKHESFIEKLERDNIKTEQEEEITKFLQDTINPIKKNKKVSNEKKQSIVRALIENIKIQWDKEKYCHRIQINYKFDKHSEILLTKNISVTYKKMGYSVRAKGFEEDVKIQFNNPSRRRDITESDTKDFFIKFEKTKK
jgi:site-specific DNA recombinase